MTGGVRPGSGGFAGIGALMLALATAGCQDRLDTEYGHAWGRSINGTGAFAEMLRESGHRVGTTSRLAPDLAGRAGVLVRFDPRFALPDTRHIDWYEQWLRGAPGRVLVYVIRDFEAEIPYWEAVLRMAPSGTSPDRLQRIHQQLDEARTQFDLERTAFAAPAGRSWFEVSTAGRSRTCRALTGELVQTAGIDRTRIEIPLHGRLILSGAPAWHRLLACGDDPLVASLPIGDSRLIVVANASFLLNFGLVDHEHRKLAAALGRSLGTRRRIVLIEDDAIVSGSQDSGGRDEPAEVPTGFDLLRRDITLRWIAGHLLVVGLVFCLARFPILGRPRRRPTEELRRFGAHVEALGDLLARAGNRAMAVDQIDRYETMAAETRS